MEGEKAKESALIHQAKSMKVSGSMICGMVKEDCKVLWKFMKVNLQIIERMVEEKTCGIMDKVMMENGQITISMVLVLGFSQEVNKDRVSSIEEIELDGQMSNRVKFHQEDA